MTLAPTGPGDLALASRELLATGPARELGLGERDARGLGWGGAESVTLELTRESGGAAVRVNITDDRGAPLASLTWRAGGTRPFLSTGPARLSLTREGASVETELSLPSPSTLTLGARGGRVSWSLGGVELLGGAHPRRPGRVELRAEGGPDSVGATVRAGWDG